MDRRLSFWVLFVAAVCVGAVFFRVVQPYLLPLLLAMVTTMVLRPTFEWTAERLGNRRGLTSILFTLITLTLFIIPVVGSLYLAAGELAALGQQLANQDWENNRIVKQSWGVIKKYVTDEQLEEIRKSGTGSLQGILSGVYSHSQTLLSSVVELLVGLAVMGLALFYFLLEGPQMVNDLRRLSPLEDAEEEVLVREFCDVSRGVVMASLACAFAQAVAAGIGFAIAGTGKIWLLSALTMFASMIPFVGAAVVWVPACLGLIWGGHYTAGIFLTVYCVIVVSSLDNIIRAYVIHDSAHLHPLIAIISVLGAIHVVGIWGIFIGPIVASFFYALLKILRDREWDSKKKATSSPNIPVC